jgi:hypothetical protein
MKLCLHKQREIEMRKRNMYRILIGNLKECDCLIDLDSDGGLYGTGSSRHRGCVC